MSHHESQNESTPDRPLPGELLAAIGRARQRRATPELVASLIEKVLQDESEVVSLPPRSLWKQPLLWGLATAAALLIGVIVATWWPQHEPPRVVNRPDQRVLSAVTKVSLVDVVFQQMTDDLDRADAELEEVSAGLQMAALRHEIEITLDEFYDRSK